MKHRAGQRRLQEWQHIVLAIAAGVLVAFVLSYIMFTVWSTP